MLLLGVDGAQKGGAGCSSLHPRPLHTENEQPPPWVKLFRRPLGGDAQGGGRDEEALRKVCRER